jgi:hypothetical protein
MAVVTPDFFPSPEAYRARSRHTELPPCDGLRLSALVMALTNYLMTTGVSDVVDLGLVVQAEFALTGCLLTRYLVGDRGWNESPGPDGPASKLRAFLRTLPTSYLFAVVASVLLVPRLAAIEKLPISDPYELPALIVSGLKSSFADFLRGSADGRSLMAWPLLILFLPRQLLGAALLAFLGGGLTVEVAGLLTDQVRPASILVAPSALDLVAAGSLGASIWQGLGKSGDGPLARWAMLMGLALVTAAIGSWSQNGLTSWGSIALLSGPAGFGTVNFILKIMATTLVGSLAWRGFGR